MTDLYLALNDRNKFSVSLRYQCDPAKSEYATLKLIYARDLS